MRTGSVSAAALILFSVFCIAAKSDTQSSAEVNSEGAQKGPAGFIVEKEMPYRARLRTTGIFINAFHLSKPKMEVIESIRSADEDKKVTVIICRGDQPTAIRDYWDVSDEYIFEALFLTPERKPPAADSIIWPAYDHPMINYIRKIRHLTRGKTVLVSVPMTSREVWGVPRGRPELFDELKWMALSVVGADFDGILWGHVRHEAEWDRRLTELTSQLVRHADDLRSASPVDWVTGPPDQPLMALANDRRLFIVLLNPDYMKVSHDRKSVAGLLKRTGRKGKVAIETSEFVIQDGTTLGDRPVRIIRQSDHLQCDYDFLGGGEMLILPIQPAESAAVPIAQPQRSEQK